MVVFRGDQVTLSLSHGDTDWRPAQRLQLACLCQDAFLPYLLVCRITFVWRVQGRGGSCEAQLHDQLSRRLVLTPGRRCGVFTSARTLTCSFLPRFGSLPKRLSITFQCHTDVSLDFALQTVKFWVQCLVVLLVAVWLDSEWIYRSVYLIRLPSVSGWEALGPTSRCRHVDLYACTFVFSMFWYNTGKKGETIWIMMYTIWIWDVVYQKILRW